MTSVPSTTHYHRYDFKDERLNKIIERIAGSQPSAAMELIAILKKKLPAQRTSP